MTFASSAIVTSRKSEVEFLNVIGLKRDEAKRASSPFVMPSNKLLASLGDSTTECEFAGTCDDFLFSKSLYRAYISSGFEKRECKSDFCLSLGIAESFNAFLVTKL